jgi:hypothetical protein
MHLEGTNIGANVGACVSGGSCNTTSHCVKPCIAASSVVVYRHTVLIIYLRDTEAGRIDQLEF